ncbi:preprotein translocase subunit YajC [Aquimarina hainanensis]|uniref:Sec translocon accessory complex subunit YajC n=1 Tax=Aquimarina hainanensis TaxID=1578017 RepID=A0ABW5N7M1_9FLAO|nr:preprotein translocase subunit YajC [Aquimarina sp. TRL1]QKX05756.1 preprotein translocase subunit YajC [Aquimarina sp. TRL1]
MEQLQSFAPFILIFVVMYFFMIRPQMQKAKKEKKFTEALKKGDRVITKSGLHGKVFDFSEKSNAVIIETGSGKLTFDKSAISFEMSQKLNAPADTKKK